RFHVVAMHEAQRRGIDAIAQSALRTRSVIEDMAQVAVAGCGADFGTDHSVRGIPQFVDCRGRNGPREARPATARFVLGRRPKQRLAGYDVNVDTGLVVVEKLAASRRLRTILLCYAMLLRREARYGLGRFSIGGHPPPHRLAGLRRVATPVHNRLALAKSS